MSVSLTLFRSKFKAMSLSSSNSSLQCLNFLDSSRRCSWARLTSSAGRTTQPTLEWYTISSDFGKC